MIEDVVDDPRDDALHGGVVDDSLHGVGLSRRRLSVGKYCAVVATQHICGEINKDFVQSSNVIILPFTMFLAVDSYTWVCVTLGFSTLSNM